MQQTALKLIAVVLVASGVHAQTTITLRAAARLDADSRPTIGDVAVVTGDSGPGLLPLDASPNGTGRSTVTVGDIQDLIDAEGIPRSQITVRGDACVVLWRTPAVPAADPSPSLAVPQAASLPAGRTIRDHVRASIERSLRLTGDSLRLRFDPADRAMLDRPTAGLTVDVHATGLGRRTPIRITLYNTSGRIETLRLRVGVQITRETARAIRSLPRGHSITASDIAVSNEWLHPDEPHIEPAVAIGQMLRRSIGAGDRLTDGTVEPPIVIERGDIVMVHVVSGAVVLRRESRAIESGRVGQKIRLEPLAGGAAMTAVVEAPGRAIIATRSFQFQEK
ncbi:MAG: flagellar basal body P-ring formation chaperone FlgA [Planctomycetota bacterium]